MKKNIWIINHYIDSVQLDKMGRHRYFAKELTNAGYNVTLIYSSAAHNSQDNEIQDGRKINFTLKNAINNVAIKTRNYVGNGKNRIFNIWDFYKGIKKQHANIAEKCGKPDVIYASSVHPFACKAGIKIAKSYKIKCICEIRDLWPLSLVEYMGISNKNPIIQYLYHIEKQIYKQCDDLIFTMEGGKEYIKERKWSKNYNYTKVHHINNGVDLEQYNRNKTEHTLQDEDLNDSKFKVCYCGSVRLVNNLQTMIDVAEIIQKTNDNIKILIYGEGDQRIPLTQECKTKGLNNIVFKGYVDKKFVPYVLSKCDVSMLNYQLSPLLKYGASQNKLFDYLAAGKPIITNAKGNYDLIEKFNCGIATNGHNVGETVDAIFKLYESKEPVRDAIGENAIELAKEYDFKVLTGKLIEIIERS